MFYNFSLLSRKQKQYGCCRKLDHLLKIWVRARPYYNDGRKKAQDYKSLQRNIISSSELVDVG